MREIDNNFICAVVPCDQKNITISEEDNNIRVDCQTHNAKTYWGKPKELPQIDIRNPKWKPWGITGKK